MLLGKPEFSIRNRKAIHFLGQLNAFAGCESLAEVAGVPYLNIQAYRDCHGNEVRTGVQKKAIIWGE